MSPNPRPFGLAVGRFDLALDIPEHQENIEFTY
jgi:hypothetical protein